MRFNKIVLLFFTASPCFAQREVVALDGQWDIADSRAADVLPSEFVHKVPVPGLAHSSIPGFVDADAFSSRQLILNRIATGQSPASERVRNAGVAHQDRNWFWYHRSFRLAGKHNVAILHINKAQFGAAVWLNGKKIGDHFPCFTAAIFDVSRAVRWNGPNDLIVRVGAHPGVLPETVSGGTDFEKNRWTPGIYDSVFLTLSDNPVITTVQIAPKLDTSSIVVQTKLHNYGGAASAFTLSHKIHPWKSTSAAASSQTQKISLQPGEDRTITQTIRIPNAKLWWPEDPNLYVLETSSGGDSVSTRFGMRELRFDTPTRRAYLNGRVYFLRGSNITLHRFFEDPRSGRLPWDEQWVRKLLLEIAKQLHWNSFRFCIGPVPDKWLDIADEAGLLIQNEYFVWTGQNWHGPENQVKFDAEEMIQEYSEWMRDNSNHPSVVVWDANNETWDPMFGEKIIPAVRGLDLSNRPWENSYNPPVGADDPVEDHPYEFQEMADGGPEFNMTSLEGPGGKGQAAMTGHAMILNEYGWLWLNRDGSPTRLTGKLYSKLLGENATAQDRLEMNAYLLAGITEYWRVYRLYAGILHFVYLTSSDPPSGYTSDSFADVEKLQLNPYFRDYMSNAFAPLGVYLSFWQPTITAGSTQLFTVMMVNDEPHPAEGTLTITLEAANGEQVEHRTTRFFLAPLGQQTYYIDFPVPRTTGKFLLKAVVERQSGGSTTSRRRLSVVMAKPSAN